MCAFASERSDVKSFKPKSIKPLCRPRDPLRILRPYPVHVPFRDVNGDSINRSLIDSPLIARPLTLDLFGTSQAFQSCCPARLIVLVDNIASAIKYFEPQRCNIERDSFLTTEKQRRRIRSTLYLCGKASPYFVTASRVLHGRAALLRGR